VRPLAIAGGAAALLALLGLWSGSGAPATGGPVPGPGGTLEGGSEPDRRASDTLRLVETTAVTPETDGVVADGAETGTATFAGGCFWCMEPPYDRLEGVRSTVSGYTGGEVENPGYRQVASGRTRHREAIRVTYDPRRVSYTRLLQVFWRNVDPTDDGGQFCDRGFQYTTAIWVHNEEQRRLAEASLERLRASGALGDRIATDVLPADAFYAAEDYHQDYYRRNPVRYESYRAACGRDRVLRKLWGEAAGG